MTVLVVDGGQSGIRARLSTDPRVVEVPGISRLEGDVAAGVAARVGEAWAELGRRPVERVGLGLTTASPHDARRLLSLVCDAVSAPEAWLADDTATTHAGALRGGWGVALAAGTGVACLAVPERGDPVVIDGHGYLLGDEGGGFWIGREAIRAVLRAAEHRDPPTVLTAAVEDRFGPIAGLAVRIHELPRAVNAIAQTAPDVLRAADEDEIASAILDRAADALVDTLVAAAGAAGGGAVPVALAGRLLHHGPLRARLDERARERLPGSVIADAASGPLEGALLLDHDSHRFDALITRYRKDPLDV